MKKYLSKFLTIAAILANCSLSAFSQGKSGKIDGIIADEGQKPLISATVSLLHLPDSAVIRQTLSNKNGHFLFEGIPEGKYRIKTTAVGKMTAWSPVFDRTAEGITLNTLFLHAAPHELAAVSVVAQKPFFEQKADRMVINVDASATNAGSSALDVLERSPGITLDKDDNISLKGKQGVTVMVDNRPTYMSAAQLASYLKSMPASAIDQIEIMTNPSSKYDAAGNSGIINIKTKKNKAQGFNGSVNLNYAQGVYPKPGLNVNLNYRVGKTNFFLNTGYEDWQGFNVLDLTRKYLDATAAKTITSIFSQHSVFQFSNPAFDIKFGMDYYLDKKTTLGIVLTGFVHNENRHSSSSIFLKDPNNVVDSMVYSPDVNKGSWKNGAVNLNFRHQFDSAGTEWTADADYLKYSATNDQYFDNLTYAPDGTEKNESILTGNLPNEISIYSIKTDYTHPFSKKLKLDAGLKSSYVTTDNSADYFDLVNGVSDVDTGKTNHFRYRENINAAYISVVRDFKKWSVQAGLRYENTHYNGRQFGNGSTLNKDSSFSNSYGSLFPTLYLSYQLNKDNQFTLNYGRRIDRPAYQDLNPFLFFLDEYTYQAGNPYLRPQFTHNLELSHTYKNFLTTTLNYSYTSEFFTETFEQQGQATIVRRGNIGSRQSAGIAVSAQLHPTKYWTAIVYSNVNYNQFDGPLYGENIHVEATTLMLNLNNQFNFSNGWSAEISGRYRTRGVEGQLIMDPQGQASAALSKKLMKDKANLKLGIRDLFNTGQNHGYVNFQQTEASFISTHDSRQVTIALNYRFGKPAKNTPRRRSSGADDEQNRVNAGGGN